MDRFKQGLSQGFKKLQSKAEEAINSAVTPSPPTHPTQTVPRQDSYVINVQPQALGGPPTRVPRKETSVLLQNSVSLAPPKRINRKEELSGVSIDDVPSVFFELGPDSEKLAVTHVLQNLPEDISQHEALQGQIIRQDILRRRVQTDLAETIMQNYQGFVQGMNHTKNTEIDLAWALSFLSQGRTTLTVLKKELITPSFSILNDYQALQRLTKLISLGRASRFLIQQHGRLDKAIETMNYIEAVKISEECGKIIGKSPLLKNWNAMKGLILRLGSARLKLQGLLMDSLSSLCDEYQKSKLESVLSAYDAIMKSGSEADLNNFNFDVEFRSMMLKKIETLCVDTVAQFIPKGRQILEQFSPDEDITVKFTELCTNIDAQLYVKCITALIKKLSKVLFAYFSICDRLRTPVVYSSSTPPREIPSDALEQLRAAAWTNRALIWERMQEFLQMLLTTQKLTVANMDEVLVVLTLGQKLMLLGDRFVEGYLDIDGTVRIPIDPTQQAAAEKAKLAFESKVDDDHPSISVSEDTINKTFPIGIEAKSSTPNTIPISTNLTMRQRLREPLNRKCREYLSSFTKECFKTLKSSACSDAWIPLPVFSDFSPSTMKELKILQATSTSAQSSMDSEKLYELFSKGEELFDTTAFSTSPKNTFVESKSEVAFQEDEELTLLRSSKLPESISRDNSVKIVTATSLACINQFAKFAMILKTLTPIQEETYEAFLEVWEFYFYVAFSCFGIRTHSFFQENSRVKSRYPSMHHLLNVIRHKFKKGKFAAGAFGQEAPPPPNVDPKSIAPAPLIRLDGNLIQKLNSDSTLRGLVERLSVCESLKYFANVMQWSVSYIAPYLPPNLERRYEKTSLQCLDIANEFSVYLVRNLADLLIPAASFNEIKRKVSMANWSTTELADSANIYVEDFINTFRAFDIRFTQLLATAPALPISSKEMVWRETLTYAFECLVDYYADISKCTPEGRALMSLDFRNIISSVGKFAPKPLPRVDFVENYIKSYYLPDSETFLKWLADHPDYRPKHFEKLCSICIVAQSLSTKKAREEFKEQVLKAAAAVQK